jgi:predicted MFS family arabinose efflux permease
MPMSKISALELVPTTTAAEPAKQPARELAAVMLLAGAGTFSTGLAPLLVNGLATFCGLSVTEAGTCIGAEMAGNGVGGALVLALVNVVPQRSLGAAALVAIIAGNLLCLRAFTFGELAAARLLAGIGCGLTLVAFGMLAATRRPQRNFSIYNGLIIAATSICASTAPWLFVLGGGNALFELLALIAAVALASLAWLPREIPSKRADNAWRIALAPERRLAVVCTLAMMLLLFVPVGAFWSYVAEIGASRDYAASFVANTISLSFLAGGVIASVTAALLGHARDHRTILRFCIVGAAVAADAVTLGSKPSIYMIGLLLFVFLWMLAWPYAMSMLAGIDTTGRLAVAGLLIQSAGFSIGPALTGSVIAAHQYAGFATFCTLLFLLSLAALALRTEPRATSTTDEATEWQ